MLNKKYKKSMKNIKIYTIIGGKKETGFIFKEGV